MQLGTAFGLAITTIVFDSSLRRATEKEGGATRNAQLTAYHAANWAVFAFGIFSAVLALLVLRGVGVVGHQTPPPTQDVEEKGAEVGIPEEKSAGVGAREKVSLQFRVCC